MNNIYTNDIQQKLEQIVNESMVEFKKHMRSVLILIESNEEEEMQLPHLYAMASIYGQLRPLHGIVDEKYPEFREIFQRIMLLQASHEMMEQHYRKLLDETGFIGNKIIALRNDGIN